jgi:hypothetical protein
MHRTPLPANPTPAPDMLGLWRAASALAQQLDEMLLATPDESSDFAVWGRARRLQHKVVRVLAGRLLTSGRAINAKAGALAESRRASDDVIR